MPLETGSTAPDISLPNQDDETVSLASFKGSKNVVVYFYPKDNTPGCTTEALDFTAMADDFAATDTVVGKGVGATVKELASTGGAVFSTAAVGDAVGTLVGWVVGAAVGEGVGVSVGLGVGLAVGTFAQSTLPFSPAVHLPVGHAWQTE